jgi:hypothetical protein
MALKHGLAEGALDCRLAGANGCKEVGPELPAHRARGEDHSCALRARNIPPKQFACSIEAKTPHL